MRIGRAVAVVMAALVVLIAGGFIYFDHEISKFGECRIVRLRSIPSPHGNRSVVIFRKECGATVSDSTHASIVSAEISFWPEKTPPFLSVEGDQDILATWGGERAIKIGLIPGTNGIYKRELSVGDVRIEYD